MSRRIVGLAGYAIAPDALALLSRAQCEEHEVIPIAVAGSTVLVAVCDPTDLAVLDDIRFCTGKNVEPIVADRDAILAAIERSYPEETP